MRKVTRKCPTCGSRMSPELYSIQMPMAGLGVKAMARRRWACKDCGFTKKMSRAKVEIVMEISNVKK